MTLIELLEELEWMHNRHYQGITCPICEEPETHKDGCDLKGWLDAAREEQAILPWVDHQDDVKEQERRDE